MLVLRLWDNRKGNNSAYRRSLYDFFFPQKLKANENNVNAVIVKTAADFKYILNAGIYYRIINP